jgi:hypothetical protein
MLFTLHRTARLTFLISPNQYSAAVRSTHAVILKSELAGIEIANLV